MKYVEWSYPFVIHGISCLFGTEIRQINMLSKRLENRSEEYYIYHKAKVDLIWITGDKIPICFYKTLILEHTTKHCTKLIRNDMAKITMNEEIPQVIRIVKRSFRAKQMDVSLKYSALYHMCNYKVTVFSNTVLIQSFYIQKIQLSKIFRMKIKPTKNQLLSWQTTFAKEICCR